MKISPSTSRLLVTAAASAAMLFGYASSAAAHSNVQLRDATGANLTGNTPYSPKQTCGACHLLSDPDNTGLRGIYGVGTKTAVKTQGVVEGDGNVYWQSYEVSGFDHGFVVGRHSQQGRNEDYSTFMRGKFGDPYFTSSPGMFGKY